MKKLTTEQMIALALATTPFFAAQFGHPKIALALGAAVIVGEYAWAHSELDGQPAQPYTSNEWITAGIYAAAVAAAWYKPKWALGIGAAVLAIDTWRAGGFGTK
jgi:hypothetical protein